MNQKQFYLILNNSKIPPHPNVVMIRGVTLPPDPVCIVTNFCSGGSLEALLLNPNKEITLKTQIKFIKHIAKGNFRIKILIFKVFSSRIGSFALRGSWTTNHTSRSCGTKYFGDPLFEFYLLTLAL